MLTSLNELWELVVGDLDKPFNYQEYLKSPAWKTKREEKFKLVGRRCQVCNRAYRLEVHHRTYERIGNEDLNDLTVLCSTCHHIFHKNGRLNESKNTKLRGRKKSYKRR